MFGYNYPHPFSNNNLKIVYTLNRIAFVSLLSIYLASSSHLFVISLLSIYHLFISLTTRSPDTAKRIVSLPFHLTLQPFMQSSWTISHYWQGWFSLWISFIVSKCWLHFSPYKEAYSTQAHILEYILQSGSVIFFTEIKFENPQESNLIVQLTRILVMNRQINGNLMREGINIVAVAACLLFDWWIVLCLS